VVNSATITLSLLFVSAGHASWQTDSPVMTGLWLQAGLMALNNANPQQGVPGPVAESFGPNPGPGSGRRLRQVLVLLARQAAVT
jgi:hypothetical protein